MSGSTRWQQIPAKAGGKHSWCGIMNEQESKDKRERGDEFKFKVTKRKQVWRSGYMGFTWSQKYVERIQ